MTTPVEDFQPGDRFLENFRIEGILGRGDMGKVYLAVDEWTERKVALKVIRHNCADLPQFMERFRQESKKLARIEHPNLVQLYGAGRAPDGRLYVIMEHLFGLSLRKIMVAAQRLDLVSALHFGIQITEAVSIAHARGILHRDVKPENVIVGMQGHVWVLDFGLAKPVENTVYTTDEKETGTPRYMSPEQIHAIPIDERADLYAIGIVIYEMIAGRHPYPDLDESKTDDTRIMAAHALAKAKPLPEVVPACPDAVWQIISRCLSKKRDARHPSADALAADLRAVLRDTVALDQANEQRGERNLDIRECLPDLATALENADEALVGERRRKALENAYGTSLPPPGRNSLPPPHAATPVTAAIGPATKQGRWPAWAVSAIAVVAVIAPVTVLAVLSSQQPESDGKPAESAAAPVNAAAPPVTAAAAPASTPASSVAAPVASASAPAADASALLPGAASTPALSASAPVPPFPAALGSGGLPPRASGALPVKPVKPVKPKDLPPEVF